MARNWGVLWRGSWAPSVLGTTVPPVTVSAAPQQALGPNHQLNCSWPLIYTNCMRLKKGSLLIRSLRFNFSVMQQEITCPSFIWLQLQTCWNSTGWRSNLMFTIFPSMKTLCLFIYSGVFISFSIVLSLSVILNLLLSILLLLLHLKWISFCILISKKVLLIKNI